MQPIHQKHCSEYSNQMTGKKQRKVQWRWNEQIESWAGSQTTELLPMVMLQSLDIYCMFISFFSVGFISMVSLIKLFVLCVFDKYLFETCKPVTEFCSKSEFQMRPLTQLFSLLSGSVSGQITETNMYLVTISVMKDYALCSTIQPSSSCWLMESEYFYTM